MTMKKAVAFVFPGQGSQTVGMGKSLYLQSDIGRRVFDEASDLLKIDIRKLCFEGPEEELRQTKNTQPTITATSIACFEVLKDRGFTPRVSAGHSLGEYSALYAAGALGFEKVLKTVYQRGELMSIKNSGTMAAIIGLDEKTVQELCARSDGKVVIANYNGPDQLVVSGEETALMKICEACKAAGAKRVIPLVVSGAFHSPLTKHAALEFDKYLNGLEISDAKIPVVMNATAQPTTNATTIKENLSVQILSPVRWVHSVKKIKELGVDAFVEVGPGRVLTGLVRRILPDVVTYNFSTLEELPNLEANLL